MRSSAAENPLVTFLLAQPGLCYLLTKGSLVLERYGWALVWVPVPAVRTAVVGVRRRSRKWNDSR